MQRPQASNCKRRRDRDVIQREWVVVGGQLKGNKDTEADEAKTVRNIKFKYKRWFANNEETQVHFTNTHFLKITQAELLAITAG